MKRDGDVTIFDDGNIATVQCGADLMGAIAE
jgi:hypothetical protein